MKNQIITKVKYHYEKIKDILLKFENRKKNLTIIGILIVVHLFLLNLQVSYGFYQDTASFSLVNAVVGNLYLDDHDYVLLVYLENPDSTGSGSGTYYLADDIPTDGYSYSGYKCHNNSTLIFDDYTMTAIVTVEQTEVCSLYFDIVENIESASLMYTNNVGRDKYEEKICK
ncbi:MAG: hypothetical protein E7161_02495 [Firmicutes bacterium]|nr:hypothetical protein [Bacillota bacterium]